MSRRPLVFATRNVLAVAEADGYRDVLENDVAAALAAGRVAREPLDGAPPLRGDAVEVLLRGGAWRARIAPGVSPSGAPCWVVLRAWRVAAAAATAAGPPSAARERERGRGDG